ncbi:endolysin [Burkholderiaceae bacterium 26]|nr:endolysin [Burkholderiaceae bacterium 26]
MNKQSFSKAASLSPGLANRWWPHIEATCRRFGISTPAQQAAFIAQIGHESGGFTRVTESFNYAVAALPAMFSRITPALAFALGRAPDERAVPLERQMRIANIAYANRYGNGDAASGDGWRYRGRGLKQITFLANYRECGHALDLDLLTHPELLERDEYAALSAGWYWWAFGLGKLADAGKFDEITRRINGPAMEGAEPRRARWAVAKQALGA